MESNLNKEAYKSKNTDGIVIQKEGRYYVSVDGGSSLLEVSSRVGRLAKIGTSIRDKLGEYSTKSIIRQKYEKSHCHSTTLALLGLLGPNEYWGNVYNEHIDILENYNKYESVTELKDYIRDIIGDSILISQIAYIQEDTFVNDTQVLHTFLVLGFDDKKNCICIEKQGSGTDSFRIVRIEDIFDSSPGIGYFYKEMSWAFKKV